MGRRWRDRTWVRPGVAAGLSVALAAGCGSTSPTAAPTTTAAAAPKVVIAEYNVDLGTDLAPLFRLKDLGQAVAAAKAAWQQVIDSNYPERAKAIATLLARQRPEVIGLQEAATWDTRDPSQPGSVFTTRYDFTALIRAALAADGVPYDATVVNLNVQAAMPLDAKTLVRYSDYNVILTRSGLPSRQLSTANPAQARYTASIPLGPPINAVLPALTRGWAAVDVTMSGRTFRFFTTHIEGYTSAGRPDDYYRNLQAHELAAMATASPYPVVVAGDINAGQPGCPKGAGTLDTPAYQILNGAGLTEVWPAVHPQDRCGGVTSGQRSLRGAQSTLDHRIDDIFFMTATMDAEQAGVFGDQPADRTPGGLWPSDHAGSVATLRFKAA